MSATAMETGTSTWALDASHANVAFAVKHLMIATVRGSFTDVTASVTMDGSDYETARITAEIDAASITTRNDQRDAHLKSADFFDVENFGKLTFTSTKVVVKSDDEFDVTGELTIRDVTRKVVLAVTIEGQGADPWGGQRTGFTASTKISRSDFGLTWNQVLEAGGVAVGDDVKITIEGEVVRQ
jgi:polyisoprenoid-binding protein YceI